MFQAPDDYLPITYQRKRPFTQWSAQHHGNTEGYRFGREGESAVLGSEKGNTSIFVKRIL